MRRFRSILMVACSCASLIACAPTEDAAEKPARLVETVTVKAEAWSESITSTGEINARVQSELSFRISGRITERLADVGDKVEAGQVLARMDAEEQEADLQVALASLQSAEAQRTQAQQALERQESLFTTGVSTQAALDEAARAGFALGEFEESEEDGAAVVEEFYPDAEDSSGDGLDQAPQDAGHGSSQTQSTRQRPPGPNRNLGHKLGERLKAQGMVPIGAPRSGPVVDAGVGHGIG